jgi:hypothetical protein
LYELDVDAPTLELGSVDRRTLYTEAVSVRVVEVLNWLFVACSDIVVSDTIVEDVDGYIEVLTVVIGWTDDVSTIDTILVELWSEIDDDALVSIVIICVDDDTSREELSVELEIEALSVTLIVFPLVLLEIPDVVVETNCAVDSSDSTGEIDSLFTVVAGAVDNVLVCSIVESV